MNQSNRRVIKGVRRALLAALGLTLIGTTSAWATVTTWTYDSSAAFNTGATQWTDSTPPTTGPCAITNSTTTLAWGCPQGAGQSSLVLNPTGGTGLTVDTWTGAGNPDAAHIGDPGIKLTHNNFVIQGNSLTDAELDVLINLTAPASPVGNPFPLNLGIQFIETSNTNLPCTVAPTDPDNPCPDIFVLNSASLSTSFNYLGDTYFLSLFPATGGAIIPLPTAACTAAGASAGCLGFVTQEGQSNAMLFGLSISSKPFIQTPEPGALGIMGLGLLGLAGLLAFRRRKLTVE